MAAPPPTLFRDVATKRDVFAFEKGNHVVVILITFDMCFLQSYDRQSS